MIQPTVLIVLSLLASAGSLGSTVSHRENATVAVTIAASDERSYRTVDEAQTGQRMTDGMLRLDVTPVTGFGVWVAGSRHAARIRTLSYSASGFGLEGGLRGSFFVNRWLGFGGLAAGSLTTEAESESNTRRALALDVGALVVLGSRAGGPNAWAGIRATPLLSDELQRNDATTKLLAPAVPLQVCVGTELWSSPLVSPPARFSPRLAIGAEARLLSGFGLSAWVSVGL